MNGVECYVRDHAARLALPGAGAGIGWSSLLRTPRFHTSSHVIFFVFAPGARAPIAIAKVPRLSGEHRFLDREAEILRAVQAARPDGFESIPRLLAYEDWGGTRLLLETVVGGRTMNPAWVRRHPEACLEAVTTWLEELQASTRTPPEPGDEGRLVQAPLAALQGLFPGGTGPARLVERSRALLQDLDLGRVPRVFEHGDLGSPNILVDAHGRAGVVDWELADPRGLPAVDLFFFLNYVAAARACARRPEAQRRAFDAAFFGPRAWALPYVQRQTRALQIDGATLRALFVLCWVRWVANLALRLQARAGGEGGGPTAELVRSDRAFGLWEHAIEHYGELVF